MTEAQGWRVGDWVVDPVSCRLHTCRSLDLAGPGWASPWGGQNTAESPGVAASEGLSATDTGQSVALEPKMMAVLVQLCQHPGEVISTDSLLMRCWSGEALSDNPVHKVIAGLRKALGDTAKTSRYIETLRKRGYRLIAPVRVLGGEAPPAVSDSWRDRSPFPGLVAFDRAHAEVFFGRDDAVATLRQRLDMQWQRGHPWVTLLGPSGSGKSSLVQAGLVPALCATRPGQIQPGWLAAGAVATADLGRAAELGLWPTLAGAMLDWAVGGTALLTGWSLASLAKALQDEPAAVFQALGAGVRRQGALPDHSAPLLILERLEALLQWPDTQASHDFIAQLALWVQARQVVVLALCRNDFYPQLAAYPALMRDKEHGAHVDLAPPDALAIDQIIRRPAQAAGLSYGLDPSGLTRLDARLYADALKTADALPLLQYTLQQLYHRRTTAQELSWQAYAEMGGLDGAIAQVAEATLAMLPPVQQARLGHLLGRLVGLSGQDQAPTGRWVPAADLNGDDEQALVAALVQARLLVTDHQGGVPGCRVAHEALLRRWPRVTAWVAQHRVSLVLREDLQPWVQRWLDGGRTPGLLLPAGGLLWQATALLAKEPALFDEAAKAFVVQSQAYWRRQRRWRRLAVAALVSLLVLAAALALHNMHLADLASQREAQSRQLTSFMLGDLADQLRPLGKLDMLARVGEQGLQVLGKDASVDPRDPPEAMLQRAKALAVIGEVHGSNGTHKPKSVPAQVLAQLSLYRFKSPQMAQDRRRADFCARSLPVLQPQIEAGAGGLVFEAWLLLRTCSPHPVADAATWGRLTSGGYRPQLLRGAAADSH